MESCFFFATIETMNKEFGRKYDRKKRLLILGLIMGVLVGGISIVSTLVLGYTSLKEQQMLLSEMVYSHITFIEKFDMTHMEDPASMCERTPLAYTVDIVATAHSRYRRGGGRAAFCVAKVEGDRIHMLVRGSERVSSDDPSAWIPLSQHDGFPMGKALQSRFGKGLERDFSGRWIVAAYGPIITRSGLLGIVAHFDLLTFLRPFALAMVLSLAVGGGMVFISLYLFHRVSDPVLQALQNSERQYRELVEGANNIIVRIQRDGIIGLANRYAREFFGFERLAGMPAFGILLAENEGQRIFDFSSNKDRQGAIEALAVRKDGSEAHVSWTVRPMMDDEGTVSELLCIGVDVTPQYLAQQARREVEERFRGIAKASPVGIVITDVHGNLIYANEKMHEMTGSYAAEMAGHGWLQHIHPEDRDFLKAFWISSKGFVNDPRTEFRMLKRDQILWVLLQRVPLNNRQGERVGYVLTFTDISRIKEAEAQHLRLAAAIEQSAEMVVITDPDGVIEYVNPAFQEVTGYSREELLGETPGILASGEHSPEFYANMWTTIFAGEVWSGRFINRRKDGTTYEQESTIAPVRNREGKIINIVAVARDVTEQLVLEAQLRQAQKLESIGELAAGIAHEINTPTQYVDSNLRFLQTSFGTLMDMLTGCLVVLDAVDGSLTDRQLAEKIEASLDRDELQFLREDLPGALDESLEGLQRVTEIVRSVKQLAHPGEVSKAQHDMNDIIRNAVTVSTNEWKYCSDMTLELDENLPDVFCLKSEMSQVLLNLIVNAAHAVEARIGQTPDIKGQIHIRTRVEEGNVVIEVEDSGTGMPEFVVERIFDPFFTTKDVGKGTGQGLAIAHNVVVLAHGGSIDVKTREGEGTTFVVRVPTEPSPGEDRINLV